MGFPEGAAVDKKVPAVVLVHGGNGHAFAQWVKIWNDRGYAAVAMDTTGYFPSALGRGKAGSHGDTASWWNYGLYGPFLEHGYVNAPDNDRMKNVSNQNIDEQWMYHAVVSTMIAHNVLLRDDRVDHSKIGICGISWGSVIAALAIGYDLRYAYAIAVYGSGYLEKSLTYFRELFLPETVRRLWSAADRFHRVKIPTLWLAWADDSNFSINTNTLTYRAMTDPYTVLSIRQNWNHSHPCGWMPEEIYWFADSICYGKNKMVVCATEPAGREIFFEISEQGSDKVSAKAYYLTKKLSYSLKTDRDKPTPDHTAWRSVECWVHGTQVTGILPKDAVCYYVQIEVSSALGAYVTSTGLVDVYDPHTFCAQSQSHECAQEKEWCVLNGTTDESIYE